MTDVIVSVRKIILNLNGKENELPDVNPSYNTEQVREFYLGMHPELLNAKAELKRDPVTGNETLTFGTQIGTKG